MFTPKDYVEGYSPSSQPPPPYELDTEPLLKWGIILKTFLDYFTPYELSRGPMLVCRAWYQFLASHLYTNIHLYSQINYIAFNETLASTHPSSLLVPLNTSNSLTRVSQHLTSLHLHGEHWESALGLSSMFSSHPAFQPSWLSTLFQSLPFLQRLELDSIPFLDEACVVYFCQHFKFNETHQKKPSSTKGFSLALTELILKKPLLLSSLVLAQWFTVLYDLNIKLTSLTLMDCPALDTTFALQVQLHQWFGWTTSLCFLNLSNNPYSLTPSVFFSLFHPSQFQFPKLTGLSIAQSTLLPFPSVIPLLMSSPIQHLFLDDVRSWNDPFPKELVQGWHSLSIKNCSLSLFQHVLQSNFNFTSLTSLTVSISLLIETTSLWSSLFCTSTSTSKTKTNLDSTFNGIPFPKLERLVIEDTLGDGIPLPLMRQLMGIPNFTLPFSPLIIVIQPRKFISYLDSLLTLEHVPTLLKESQGKCFLRLIERNTVTTW